MMAVSASKVHLAMMMLSLTTKRLGVSSFRLNHVTRHSRHRHYSSTTVCRLNRFLFDPSEVDASINGTGAPTVTLPIDDYRTIHAASVLGVHNGDTVRAGLVSCNDHKGLLTDEASIQWIPEGKVKKAEPLANGNPPGSLQFTLDRLVEIPSGSAVRVSLLLALPRPLALGRVLPMIAQMGVDHLILTGASKVPKAYFGSHLFKHPEQLRERLVEGLCQAGDVRLPTLTICKNVGHFLSDDLDRLFPMSDYARVVCHPQRLSEGPAKRMRQVEFPPGGNRILLAVGPEGGWEEPTELDRFRELGFQQVTLGTRILRSDVAVVTLMGLANDVCDSRIESSTI
jgi:RsmE family RNA methyltransferase